MRGEAAYHAPGTLDETLSLLYRLGSDATVLAGGQDVVPLMNQGRLHPANLIDLKALHALAAIQADNGSARIGSRVTHRAIERSDVLRARCGLLVDAAAQIGGGIQVRNRGTIGGAVCSGNPVYDFAPCLVALDAEVRLLSVSGERRMPAVDFFRDASVVAARPDELVADIDIPLGLATAETATGYAYEKLKFTDGCYCIASAACVARLGADGALASVHLALGGVEPVPLRLTHVETRMAGARPTDRLLDEVTAATREGVTHPIDDIMADGEYRRAMAGVVARRALSRAVERAAKAFGDRRSP